MRADVPDGFEQAAVVEPVDPFEHRELDIVDAAPGAAPANHFSLEQPDDRLGQGIVIAVADRADRVFDAGLGERSV